MGDVVRASSARLPTLDKLPLVPEPVVDVASNPYLDGIFRPISTEVDADRVEVVQGAVPSDLSGSYLRNGPNPRFPPIGSYTFPIDGDGMVHGLWFEDGTVRYRNRFVETPGLRAEERAQRALWPGLMTFDPPTADLVGADLAGTFKDLPDINVVRHAGRLLALAEGNRPFELTAELATVGPWLFDGGLPKGLCAHPKVDPHTGELVAFRYDFTEPFLTWSVVGRDGTMAQPETAIEIDGTYMIHDCAITEHHLVLFVCPFRFDIAAAMRGQSVLAWEPERGTRIAVVPRDGSAVRWFDAEPFWVWHFANAFEDGTDRIIVDFCRWEQPVLGGSELAPQGSVQRATLPLDGRPVRFDTLDDRVGEFPRVDDRLLGRRHHRFHVAGVDPDQPPPGVGMWNTLERFDADTGHKVVRRGGLVCFGEAVFAPRRDSADEDDGYVMTYAYDTVTTQSTFIILDAADIAGEPVATLQLPQRVPFGLHGAWLPA